MCLVDGGPVQSVVRSGSWRRKIRPSGLQWVNPSFIVFSNAYRRLFYMYTIAFRLYMFISMCVPWESNPQPFALQTQCSTTEPHRNTHGQIYLYALNTIHTECAVYSRAHCEILRYRHEGISAGFTWDLRTLISCLTSSLRCKKLNQ